MTPIFLMLDEVLALHGEQIDWFGGSHGIRDPALLDSALSTPRASFDGSFLHPTLFEMAAAYLFHLCRNHPFVDGNKRTALKVALVFLGMNDLEIEAAGDELVNLVLGVAKGKISKAEIAVFLQSHTLD